MRILGRAAGVIGLLFTLTATQAEVSIKRGDFSIDITVTGKITREDAETIQLYSSEFARTPPSIFLNSEGGDLGAALEIGRVIRKADAATAIPEHGKCYSSCALIFIAGVRRYNFGEIGLHRPYLSDTPRSREELERLIPRMLSLVKEYVAEMGVNESFFNQIANTEPSKMVIYGLTDYENLVPQNDPTYEEIRIAREARQRGITTSELRRREKFAERCYVPGYGPQSFTCADAISWGLSEQLYKERDEMSFQKCKVTDTERAILRAIPRKQAEDHVVTIKYEACRRNIMLGR